MKPSAEDVSNVPFLYFTLIQTNDCPTKNLTLIS